MLEGLDEIDWTALEHAYGDAGDVPQLLHGVASDDPDTFAEAHFELCSSIFHQGTVYSASAPAVRFLIGLALRPGGRDRHRLLGLVGAMADPDLAYGDSALAVKTAVAAEAGRVMPLLDDADVRVRETAAYLLGQCGAAAAEILPVLHRRADVESEPLVRASLLAAAARLDPLGAANRVDLCLHDREPAVQAAAVFAHLRSGRPVTAAVPEAIISAWRDGTPLTGSVWPRHTLDKAVDALEMPHAAHVLAALADSSRRDVRHYVAHTVSHLNRCRRSALPALLPLLEPLLGDPDEDVRRAAASAAAEAGAAAAPLADSLAAATRFADPASAYVTGADHALKALLLIGDPRWREPVLAAWAAGHRSYTATDTMAHLALDGHPIPMDDELLDAVRVRLTVAVAVASGLGSVRVTDIAVHNEPVHLTHILRGWGAAAQRAVPELVSALGRAPHTAGAALAAMGEAAMPALPALRAIPVPACAQAVWQLTGDAAPLVEIMSALLDRPYRNSHEFRHLLALGPAALPLLPKLTALLANPPDSNVGSIARHQTLLAAATVVWRLTGDAEAVLPTLREALTFDGWIAGSAAALARELGEAAAPLLPQLREALGLRQARVRAAEVLWQLGTDAEQLVEPVLEALRDGWGPGTDAVDLLVRMRAVSAAATLRELAERDRRLIASGSADEIITGDEALRARLRQGVAQLSAEVV
ncbi:hypothetical protein CS0771_63510 [Catellatospora sp. IY07-71]|uniref:hypothetical protein n=1 Tax=Catellatospora sp. IY07-71 TaxID=2728827 RepID=UPI001BB4490E|nr:hypothetical protein [Catellatospora sp. IY07-71]BCJ76807.1 hypothetical protein CS0771_63510 [Catellatospora sp. IY07-71]